MEGFFNMVPAEMNFKVVTDVTKRNFKVVTMRNFLLGQCKEFQDGH